MILDFVFVIFIIFISIFLEIRTHQKKRVIIASSGMYIIVLYFVLFDLLKDQTVLLLVVKFRPDLIIESLAPIIIKIFTTNPFQESQILIKLLNVVGIKEGTKLFELITTYRPASSTSPLAGVSLSTSFSLVKNVVNGFFGWTSYEDYCTNKRKLAYIFVLILFDEVDKANYILQKANYRFKTNLLIA